MSANRVILALTALCAAAAAWWVLSGNPSPELAAHAVESEASPAGQAAAGPPIGRAPSGPPPDPVASASASGVATTGSTQASGDASEQRKAAMQAQMEQKKIQAAADTLFAKVAVDLDLSPEESQALRDLLREERAQALELQEAGRSDEYPALREQTAAQALDLLGDERFETYTALRSQAGPG